MTLTAIPVDRLARVERMRQIRNATAAGYANFNGRISFDQQVRWWEENQRHLRAWLYLNPAKVVVGFGLLTRHADFRWYTTVGVLPEHGRRNYGKEITAHLIRQAPGRVYGAARRDNPAAVRLHVEDDWSEVPGPDPRLVYFRTHKPDPWPPEPAIEQWAEAGWVTA